VQDRLAAVVEHGGEAALDPAPGTIAATLNQQRDCSTPDRSDVLDVDPLNTEVVRPWVSLGAEQGHRAGDLQDLEAIACTVDVVASTPCRGGTDRGHDPTLAQTL